MSQHIGKGNSKPVIGWLNKHVHQYGALYTPEEVLYNATGETLSAKHYVDYITKKYRSIYEI